VRFKERNSKITFYFPVCPHVLASELADRYQRNSIW